MGVAVALGSSLLTSPENLTAEEKLVFLVLEAEAGPDAGSGGRVINGLRVYSRVSREASKTATMIGVARWAMKLNSSLTGIGPFVLRSSPLRLPVESKVE